MIQKKINNEVTDALSLSIFHEEDTKHYPINGLTSNFQESRYTSDYFVSKYSSHSPSVSLTAEDATLRIEMLIGQNYE